MLTPDNGCNCNPFVDTKAAAAAAAEDADEALREALVPTVRWGDDDDEEEEEFFAAFEPPLPVCFCWFCAVAGSRSVTR